MPKNIMNRKLTHKNLPKIRFVASSMLDGISITNIANTIKCCHQYVWHLLQLGIHHKYIPDWNYFEVRKQTLINKCKLMKTLHIPNRQIYTGLRISKPTYYRYLQGEIKEQKAYVLLRTTKLCAFGNKLWKKNTEIYVRYINDEIIEIYDNPEEKFVGQVRDLVGYVELVDAFPLFNTIKHSQYNTFINTDIVLEENNEEASVLQETE